MKTNDTSTEQVQRWQLVLAVGDAASWASMLGDTAVTVTGDAGVFDDVALSAADLRARAVVAVDNSDVASLSAWAFLSGLAGRILDVVTRTDGEVDTLDCQSVTAAGRATEAPRPAVRIEDVTLSIEQAAAGSIDVDTAGAGRWAKRVTVPWCAGLELYRGVAWVAGLRDRRGDGGRLPQVVVGDSALDLEGTRLRGAARRRSTNTTGETAVADPVALTDRQRRLLEASSRPVEEILGLLGSQRAEDLWNCPRPDRHTHGDAVPSMRSSGNAVRCFRCDSEWTDALRLMMDITGFGPDDAAAVLTGPDAGFTHWRDSIVAEREQRSAAQKS